MNEMYPIEWGLESGEGGRLIVAGCRLRDLALTYGTPLHVVHEERLEQTARSFLSAAQSAYAGKVSVHYPFKCNALPAVVGVLRKAGMRAEVMTPFELDLAFRLGYGNQEIIANGPCKTAAFLRECLERSVRLIVADSLEEIRDLLELTKRTGRTTEILLRVNPDYVPRGMNRGSATASRTGCAFGLDWKGGEVGAGLNLLRNSRAVRFRGFHFHIGTGIRRPGDYTAAFACLPDLVVEAHRRGLNVEVLDVGGGMASATSREFTSREMLEYQALEILPPLNGGRQTAGVADFAMHIVRSVERAFNGMELPELIYEPGRCITGANQMLLLTVHRIKRRAGKTWIITDGGLGTVSLPTFYEWHEILLCNDVRRPRSLRATIIGPGCFAGDVIYRNKPMPEVNPGDVIAVMDTGAYFLALESSFGFPRSAVVSVRNGIPRLIRHRETFKEMIQRDELLPTNNEVQIEVSS